MGFVNVDPGGPVIYVAVTGSENLFESANTAINDARCSRPAETFHFLKGLICASLSLFIFE